MYKGIEWLKAQICTEMMYLEHIRKERWSGVKYQTLRSVYQKIDQLDEPEALSQEWISDHIIFNEKEDAEYVYADKLQNLLVPKQELPVIPKYVADYIDGRKEVGFPIYQAIRIVRENSRFEHSHIREWLWTNKGQETFVRAWLDGYTVEKEQKYLVNILDEGIGAYLIYYPKSGNYGVTGVLDDSKGITRFTEQEIKDYDERFWAFAKKVEELEE